MEDFKDLRVWQEGVVELTLNVCRKKRYLREGRDVWTDESHGRRPDLLHAGAG